MMLSEEDSLFAIKQGEGAMKEPTEEVARINKEARLEERKMIEDGLERRLILCQKHDIVMLKIRE